MANSFSLLRLPNEERLQVLRCMDRRALLLFSLLSRNTKDLIRSLQLKPISSTIGPWRPWLDKPPIEICISNRVCLAILSWIVYISFYTEPQENMGLLGKPNKLWIRVEESLDFNTRSTEIEIQNPLEIKEWYEHILYITNDRLERQIILTEGHERFDLKTIKSVFGRFYSLLFAFGEPRDYEREVLNTFLPNLEKLTVIQNPYPSGDTRLQKLLIQNFDSLELGYFKIFERLDVNDLLVCNAHHIKFSLNQQFENINRFLKLWIKGSNRRLQKLAIEQTTYFFPEEVLKGIRIIREVDEENVDRQFAHRKRAVDIERYDAGSLEVSVFDLGVFLKLYNQPEVPEDNIRILEKPQRFSIKIPEFQDFDDPRNPWLELPNPFNLKEWLDHIRYLFQSSSYEEHMSFDQGFERFDLKILKNQMGNLDSIYIEPLTEPSRTESKDILRIFSPDLRILTMETKPFAHNSEDAPGLQKTLIQNFDMIGLGFFTDFDGIVTLDDLLICNAHRIELQDFKWINKFLKLWVQGANPRLQELSIRTDVNPDEIVKGLRIEEKIFSEEDLVEYNKVSSFKLTTWDDTAQLKRFDGTRGLIYVDGRSFWFLVA